MALVSRRLVPASFLATLMAALVAPAAGCSLLARFDAPTRNECDEALKKPFYRDTDGDGFGTSAQPADVTRACFAPAGFAERAGDCNDADPAVHPTAQELCDGQDNDCSSGGGADPLEDADRDGHAGVTNVCAGGSLPKDDCDDGNSDVAPGKPEVCDGRDDDCNGQTDENPAADAFCAQGAHARSQCHGGSCIASCAAGFADCDNNVLNGCETDVTTSAANCGACGVDCGVGGRCDAGFCREQVLAVAAGVDHTCALRGAGDHAVVACWGDNSLGQLGVTTVAGSSSRLPVLTALPAAVATQATQLAVGAYHNCAVAAGGVFCWGLDDQGQLGHATNSAMFDATPAAVAGLANVTRIAASGSFNCALSGGGVQCWGDNRVGQLGTGSTADSEVTPAPVPGISDATAVALGGGELEGADQIAPGVFTGHACALHADGSLSCWGDNRNGQLGLGPGAPLDTDVPPTLVPTIAGVTAVALGSKHSCATVTGGAVQCWGSNSDGQLGGGVDPTAMSGQLSTTPVPVRAEVSDVAGAVGVTAQGSHACAFRAHDTLCWGDNAYGELGNGDLTDSDVAVTVDAMPDAKSVAAGWYHACAVRQSGQLACWGDNESGQLGDGTNARRRAPVRVLGLSSGVRLAGGLVSACGLRADGTVSCWGGDSGINGVADDSEYDLLPGVPLKITSVVDAVEIAVGETHACARTAAGEVRCWGTNDADQLGPMAPDMATPGTTYAVTGLAAPAQITAAHDFTCALQGNGSVACWGDNANHEVDPHSESQSIPTPNVVIPAANSAFEVRAGLRHACARQADGTVVCWGANDSGQSGAAPGADVVPTLVPGITDAVGLAVGARHACALRGSGAVWCWGANDSGQLGRGDSLTNVSPGATAPPAAVAALTDVVQIAAGDDFTCARRKDATVWCWGRNGFGQLGTGDNQDSSRATVVGNANNVIELTTGRDFACARQLQGNLICWGRNDAGQLGDQTDDDRATPVTVRSLP